MFAAGGDGGGVVGGVERVRLAGAKVHFLAGDVQGPLLIREYEQWQGL